MSLSLHAKHKSSEMIILSNYLLFSKIRGLLVNHKHLYNNIILFINIFVLNVLPA